MIPPVVPPAAAPMLKRAAPAAAAEHERPAIPDSKTAAMQRTKSGAALKRDAN